MRAIKRSSTWKLYDDNWCAKCGKVVNMEPIRIGTLPGIPTQKCLECNSHYTVNYLEDEDDLLTIDNKLIFPDDIEILIVKGAESDE